MQAIVEAQYCDKYPNSRLDQYTYQMKKHKSDYAKN